MALNIGMARAHFPALHSGWAFFDNAGGSLVLKPVADRISDYLLTTSVQTGASYDVSRRASARLAEARSRIAGFMGASRPEEIVFGPSTTVLMRFLATAMASQFKPGDEIILTEFDHESNIGPWLTLTERGVVFKVWKLNADTLEPDLADLGALMTDRTKLICVTHVSNILGRIHPIAEIASFVHRRGAKICVDGVAYAPHRRIDVLALGADYYVFSFYKTFGPHFAVLFGKHEQLLELDGLYHYFYGRDKTPGKLEPGNPNYELAWGCGAIVDYLESLGGGGDGAIARAFEAIAAHEAVIGERLLSWLRQRNNVRIVGPRSSDPKQRVPTISFKVEDREAAEIVAATDNAKIGIRHGDFHSRRLVEALGLANQGGVIRVSMVHYNTLEEVDRLIKVLDSVI